MCGHFVLSADSERINCHTFRYLTCVCLLTLTGVHHVAVSTSLLLYVSVCLYVVVKVCAHKGLIYFFQFGHANGIRPCCVLDLSALYHGSFVTCLKCISLNVVNISNILGILLAF